MRSQQLSLIMGVDALPASTALALSPVSVGLRRLSRTETLYPTSTVVDVVSMNASSTTLPQGLLYWV